LQAILNMNDKSDNPKTQLIRESATLQLKLLADGGRDALLIPLSIIATLVGLARGGDEPDREFRRIMKLGRRSERWINLFGHQQPLNRSHPAGSLDTLLHRVESVVVEQYSKARTAEEAKQAISDALWEAQGGDKPVTETQDDVEPSTDR
jgi:hypothetical protein